MPPGIGAGLTVLLLSVSSALALAAGKHLGVATCANSACHAASEAMPSSQVLQYEFFVWRDHDKHSRAYRALQSARGQAIARTLGLGPATEAPQCLSCHSDYVPAEQRGSQHKLSDGVGCEACHGGAESWLGIHASGVSTHKENLAAGMYPTDQPVARARLCLGCHLAQGDPGLSHAAHAAGHPRLRFELDSYSDGRPAHHQVDQDYRLRKANAYGAQAWALGQQTAAQRRLEALAREGANPEGLFPELSHFECLGCHQQMGDGQSGSHGVPRTDDAALVLLSVIAQVLAPARAQALDGGIGELHRAAGASRSAWLTAAEALLAEVRGLRDVVSAGPIEAAATRQMLDEILRWAAAGRWTSAGQAEQASHAVSTLIFALELAGVDLSSPALDQALDRLFTLAGQMFDFDAAAWQKQAAAVQRAMP